MSGFKIASCISVFFVLYTSVHADPVIDRIAKRRKLFIGYENTSDTKNILFYQENEEYCGIEYELGKYIAEQLNVETVVVLAKRGRLLQLIDEDKIDLALQHTIIQGGNMKNTDVIYSDPYITTGLGLLCNKKVECTPAIFNSSSIKTAILNEPFSLEFGRKFSMSNPKIFIRILDTEKSMYDSLYKQSVDVLIYGYPLLASYHSDYEKLFSLHKGYLKGSEGGYAIIMKPEAVKLRKKINLIIKNWKELDSTVESLKTITPKAPSH
ncbi:MAG: transporter substrate-binding domain-containing protein [Oligoflexales bacterium]|nr:transporter substrate-binding domain-containing protein [Oligoflexales bacterium]